MDLRNDTSGVMKSRRQSDGSDVRFWHKADITIALNDVRFRMQSGRRSQVPQCPFLEPLGTSEMDADFTGWHRAGQQCLRASGQGATSIGRHRR